MRPSFSILLPCLLLALVAAPRGVQAQTMKPFKIEGRKIPEIKPPEQPSYKITKPEPYKATPPVAPKTYAGEPILKSAPVPEPAKRSSATKKSGAAKSSARKSTSRAGAPPARRVVAPRAAPAPSSPLGFGRGRGRLFRGIR